ncbi:MAG: glycerol kinase GlpK [Acidobacteriota bacterium]|nr:glycerol kinase GlpK [Acidobacteriota bacterium]MDH5567350.1 glycerol kinase GlpK [Myxococcales bacterium]
MGRYVMALDQGTTSSRAILFDRAGTIVAVDQHEFPQHFPQPGWVEHDPIELWESQLRAARGALRAAGATGRDIAAIGITNQRETALVWDRSSGQPVHRAIVWQSRQTAPICEALRARGLEQEVRARTGLVIDAYFSGTKIRFILDAVEGLQQRAERGELAFGTVDSWLIHRLTRGRVHATEYSNASRTLLYNIHTRAWDELLLEALRIPRAMLPEVRDTSGCFGVADAEWFGAEIPIAGVAGDQQAALFGQRCAEPGKAKNTYGTGCFLLMNTGSEAPVSRTGLVTTIAWGIGGRVDYALEGSVFVAGAAVQWLRDGLGLLERAGDSEAAARSVEDTGGVYLVPAFVGLGAPYWDERARGTIVGITRGTTRAHLIRATLESIAYQTRDIVECVQRDASLTLDTLRVDGGACRNDFLMQFQADVLGVPVERPAVLEVTALGAAGLAGLGAGFWREMSEIGAAAGERTVFEPDLCAERRESLYAGWKRAVERSRGWAGA